MTCVVRELREEEFQEIISEFDDPILSDFESYEKWIMEMGILRVFWASGGKRIALLGAFDEKGVLRGGSKSSTRPILR